MFDDLLIGYGLYTRLQSNVIDKLKVKHNKTKQEEKKWKKSDITHGIGECANDGTVERWWQFGGLQLLNSVMIDGRKRQRAMAL